MRRGHHVVVVDRILLALLGLVLVVVGAALVVAQVGWPDGVAERLPDRLDLGTVQDAVTASWWPPAIGALGLLLVGLGLWWLLTHLPARPARVARLPGSRSGDRLEIEPAAVARAAGRHAAASPHVRSARLVLAEEHGSTVLRGTVRVGQHAPLEQVAEHLGQVTTEASQVLGDDRLTGRVHLTVARRDQAPTRAPS